ncbi:carbohydrate ABC transporter permease [Streptosporangium sp. NBC_01639]|uniref:carbohydrate ABC transporter permease n=1 Tax=unclassified Streptosporangium TaxID=2632669 RepID=UPI002DDC3D2E|nr:carbohydrate ABC transporter permease [Streptosporangium sp. NBC_01756]WSC85252.1 carbohydrate ABC transporter permease [Streptosporangium sp. NBC_01756]WTD56120.1 carbohydrate ABC transporter permease [Streptosporangium sp. NBC_01639]
MTPKLAFWLRRAGMYVLLTAIALVFVGPFLILLSAAFKPAGQAVFSFPPDIIPRPPVLTWVKEAWTTIPYLSYLLNSVIYVGVMVPAHIIVSALCAYPLAQANFRGKNLIFFAILSTMFLPGEVMLLPRFLVVSQLGMADTYAGVILPGLLSAFGIFLLRQTFAGVPREVIDAARTDGCHELRIFWHVMLPAARPTLAILGIFGFISVWNSFIWPMVVLKDSAMYPIALGISYLAGVTGTDVRSLAAGTVISILPVVIFFMIMQRHVLEGMRGAVKG